METTGTRIVHWSAISIRRIPYMRNLKASGRGEEEDFYTEYDALSYTWGVPREARHIVCDGHDFPITENLFEALRMLRPSGSRTPGRYLWVDSICIDQTSDNEKGEQVWNMFAIYQKASKVVAWLGPAADGVEDALTAATSTDYAGWHNLEKICSGLLHLYTRSWLYADVGSTGDFCSQKATTAVRALLLSVVPDAIYTNVTMEITTSRTLHNRYSRERRTA
jgi:hypothetical protein